MNEPVVLVVHCIDTEGPLGGDARRLPDGSPEFFDAWPDIRASLAELTGNEFRQRHTDSFGAPYRFNWFIMDFTGFQTNPKNRGAEYHNTWDNITSLPCDPDGLYWHYHVPPASGVGDEWSDSWLTSNECNTILARRLLERGSFPEAFRAGGTIEDDAASRWLEEVFLLDYSNRVSARSHPGADLYHFNWHGAPEEWGSYHPSHASFLRPGCMRRLIYRCIDLRSRYNDLTVEIAEECFRAAASGGPCVLSYFSHDNRDMRPETYDVHALLTEVSDRVGVPWRSCTAVEAHQRFNGLDEDPVALELETSRDLISISTDGEVFQRIPFFAAELDDQRFVRLYPRPRGERRWELQTDTTRLRRIGAGVTAAASGVATVEIEQL